MAQPGRRSAIYGSQGSAQHADGSGLPVTVDSNVGFVDKANVDPSRLDAAIDSLVRLCEDGAALIDENGPMLRALMQRVQVEANRALARIEALSNLEQSQLEKGEDAASIPGLTDMLARSLDIVNKVTVVMDRVNKMLVNAVKAKDTAIRLRTFIATGDSDTHGLENLSENALRRMINLTANGEMLPSEERRG